MLNDETLVSRPSNTSCSNYFKTDNKLMFQSITCMHTNNSGKQFYSYFIYTQITT